LLFDPIINKLLNIIHKAIRKERNAIKNL
jgi:hypothetical protein